VPVVSLPMPNELRSRSSRFSARRASRWSAGLAVTALSLSAAGGSSAAESPGGSGELASALPAAGQLASGEHPIAVRVGDAGGELFDKRSGETFFARGPSYLRLETVDGVRTSTLFAPETADPERTASDLAAMKQLGFNSVRVFIDLCVPSHTCIGNPEGGLNAAYMDNLAAFLRLAAENELQVMLASADLPMPYADRLPCCDPFGGGRNSMYLAPGGPAIAAEYWRDIITALRERGAPLDTVLAYQLAQEQSVFGDRPPLSLTSGAVTTANGETYDMADPDAKQQLIEDNVLYFIDQVRTAILEEDPTALVTMGFFVPHGPHAARPGDSRIVYTERLIRESALDIIDLHAYPGGELTLQQFAENFGVTGADEKPIVLGELGGITAAYPTARDAAIGVVAWQVNSCSIGIDGWYQWIWEDEVSDVYGTLVEGGIINEAMAPSNRPDPCTYGEVVPRNFANNAQVTASAAQPGGEPELAVDDRNWSAWTAGPAPQWIDIDLGAAATVSEIRLMGGPGTAPGTAYRVIGRDASGAEQLLAEIGQLSGDAQWVSQFVTGGSVAGIETVRIEATAGPVASLREIWVLGPSGG
jgi:F5/8 type C domain